MMYVYLLQSASHPNERYVGVTADLRRRLREHNSVSAVGHTAKYRPWDLVTYIAFSDHGQAASFERYLKSGSGHAFAKKRLWQATFARPR